jgi:hypothetical protein
MICLKCKRDLPIERFTRSRDKAKRRSRRCSGCKRSATCAVKRWHKQGRPCARCAQTVPCPEQITDYPWRDGICKACQKAKTREFQREWARNRRAADPEYRRRQIAATLRWQKRNRAVVRIHEQRRYERMRADPERYARFKGDQRMRYRLRRERAGAAPPPLSVESYVERYGTGFGKAPTVPAEPLAPLLRSALAEVSEASFARESDVSPRRIRDIVSGVATRVSLVNADKLCVYLGLPFTLIYGDLDADAA